MDDKRGHNVATGEPTEVRTFWMAFPTYPLYRLWRRITGTQREQMERQEKEWEDSRHGE